MDGQGGRSKGVNPFTYSRLRGYASSLEHVIDAKSSIGNAMAVAYSQPLSTSLEQLPPLSDAAHSLGGTGRLGSPKGSPKPPGTAGSMQSEMTPQVMAEIGALRAEIAGVESVLGFMKAGSEGGVSPLGRKSTPLNTQLQLRQRAEQYVRTITDAPLVATNASLRRTASPASVAGTEPYHITRGWVDDSGLRAYSAPARPEEGFEKLSKDLKNARTWRPSPAPQPVGRGEAVVLEAALDEALPAGGIAAKYQPWSEASQSPAQVFLLTQDIVRDFDALESVQREAARQAASHCSERGRLLTKVAERYREFFTSLINAVANLRAAKGRLRHQLDDMGARCDSQEALIDALRQQVSAAQQATESEREARKEVEAKMEQAQQDAEAKIDQLKAQNELLVSEVDHYMARLMEAREKGEEALEEGTHDLEDQVASLEDEKDSLAQRIRFLERQIMKMREDSSRVAPTEEVGTDVDASLLGPIIFEQEATTDDGLSVMGAAQDTPEVTIRIRRKQARTFGGFAGMVGVSSTQGRIRGAHWTVACIAQIYADKIVADAVSDREGNPRASICEFAYDWHLTRYGLRNLAESNLLDLITSVRHHARRLQRVRWFGMFTGLVESPEKTDTPQHLAFYLFVLQQLAYPSSITGLFAMESGNDDAPVLIKQQQAQEAVKAVFRYMNDPDAANAFLARYVENQPPDPDLGISGVVRADELVKHLVAQYRNRLERNVAHLKALFRAGDLDKDGLISYDEFVMLFRHANPDTTDRLMTKIYGEAVRMLPHGQYLITQDVFVEVAHLYGLDRWRIEAGSLVVSGLGDAPAATPALSRALSIKLRDPATTSTLTLASAGGGRRGRSRPVAETLAQSELLLLRHLESTLAALDPPLQDMMTQAQDRVSLQPSWAVSDPELMPRIVNLHKRMTDARTGGPTGGPTDAAAAWLSFRLLYAALTAVLNRRAASRPTSRAPGSPSRRTTFLVGGPGAWRSGTPPTSSGILISGMPGGDGIAAAASGAALNLRSSTPPGYGSGLSSPTLVRNGTGHAAGAGGGSGSGAPPGVGAGGVGGTSGSWTASRSPSHSPSMVARVQQTRLGPGGGGGGGSGGGGPLSPRGAAQHLQQWVAQAQQAQAFGEEGDSGDASGGRLGTSLSGPLQPIDQGPDVEAQPFSGTYNDPGNGAAAAQGSVALGALGIGIALTEAGAAPSAGTPTKVSPKASVTVGHGLHSPFKGVGTVELPEMTVAADGLDRTPPAASGRAVAGPRSQEGERLPGSRLQPGREQSLTRAVSFVSPDDE